MNEFTQLELNENLLSAIEKVGYEKPTPVQEQVIPIMLAGDDVFVQSQTGSGKTAAFVLPILNNLQPGHKKPQCLVMSPTRELAMQVASVFHELGEGSHFSILPIFGGQAYSRQISRLQKGVDVVVGTPGRMLDLINKGELDLSDVKIVVLDEADEMLSMGFIDDIRSILDEVPQERQTTLFSATLPHAIRQLGSQYMQSPQTVQIKREHLTVDSIDQRYYLVNQKQKFAALTRLFEMEDIERALVFASTKVTTEKLANRLSLRGFQAEVINGNLEQSARIRVLERFKQNHLKVLVATDVAARGLDIDDISHVFNYDLPREVEGYVHRIGRTGRAGKEGIAISFVNPKELWFLKRIEKYTKQEIRQADIPTEEDILQHREDNLLERMRIWLKRGRCSKEKELISLLVEEGFDAEDIAAVTLKMARADEKSRPVMSFDKVTATISSKSNKKKKSRKKSNNKYDAVPKEDGMVSITVNSGHQNGINPSEIVGAIARFSKIPGNSIGKILIKQNHSLVDIESQYVEQVLEQSGQIKMRKKRVTFKRA